MVRLLLSSTFGGGWGSFVWDLALIRENAVMPTEYPKNKIIMTEIFGH